MTRTPLRLARLVALCALAVAAAAKDAPAADWKESVKAFRDGVRASDWKQRKQAYAALADADGAPAVEEILAAISKEENAAVVAAGIQVLSRFMTAEAANALAAAGKKEKGPKGTYALVALGSQKSDVGKDGLLEITKGTDSRAIALAALALGKKQVAAALPRLVELLRHKEWQVRVAAARGLKPLAASITKDQYPLLLDALAAAEGRERADLIDLLKTIFKQDFGYDPPAWRELVAGADPAKIARKPVLPGYVVGIPIYAKRVAVVVAHTLETDSPHPFSDRARLQELCKVPGARDVPWFAIKTVGQFMNAHARRLVNDLPDGTQVEVVTAGGQMVKTVFGRLTPVNAGARVAVEKALENLKAENGFFAMDALNAALDSGGKDAASWATGPEEIVVLTAGMPWLAKVNEPEVIGSAIGLKARMRLVTIHAIGVGPHAPEMSRRLADFTGGTYLDLQK